MDLHASIKYFFAVLQKNKETTLKQKVFYKNIPGKSRGYFIKYFKLF